MTPAPGEESPKGIAPPDRLGQGDTRAGQCPPNSECVAQTTAALPQARVTVVTEAATAGESARVGRPTWSWASLPSVYTLGSGEGGCAPLRTPGSCAADGAADGRGASPGQAPEPPHRRALGGAAHRCGSRPRPSGGVGRLAFGAESCSGARCGLRCDSRRQLPDVLPH